MKTIRLSKRADSASGDAISTIPTEADSQRESRLGLRPSCGRGPHLSPLQRSKRVILVPIDFQPASLKAMEHAFTLARQLDASILLLHVVDPIYTGGFLNLVTRQKVRRNGHTTRSPEFHVESSQDFSARMEALVPKAARGGGIRTRAEVLEHNEPALAICQIVDQFDADLICMAARKRPWLHETLFGSVSQRMMVRSGRPVLITRSPGREPGDQTLVETLTKNGG